jgi:enoyl-CoA hydratase/carnithine racemase
MYARLRNLPKPVIGALNGLTMAGGLELALSCDILFAADSVKIGDAHANFGVFPGAGGAAILPKRVGLNNAKYLLFSGQTLPAAQFLASGFISEVVSAEQLNERVAAFAATLTTKSPIALRRMKEVANASLDRAVEDALRHELLTLRQHLRSHDMNEGLQAFREKRKPDFKGY